MPDQEDLSDDDLDPTNKTEFLKRLEKMPQAIRRQGNALFRLSQTFGQDRVRVSKKWWALKRMEKLSKKSLILIGLPTKMQSQ